jgi:hypothetical protein
MRSPAKSAPLAVPPHAHGRNGYSNYRCRCDECRAANTAAQSKYRDRLAQSDPDAIPHGTTNGYDNFRCRCDECRDAKAVARAASQGGVR